MVIHLVPGFISSATIRAAGFSPRGRRIGQNPAEPPVIVVVLFVKRGTGLTGTRDVRKLDRTPAGLDPDCSRSGADPGAAHSSGRGRFSSQCPLASRSG